MPKTNKYKHINGKYFSRLPVRVHNSRFRTECDSDSSSPQSQYYDTKNGENSYPKPEMKRLHIYKKLQNNCIVLKEKAVQTEKRMFAEYYDYANVLKRNPLNGKIEKTSLDIDEKKSLSDIKHILLCTNKKLDVILNIFKTKKDNLLVNRNHGDEVIETALKHETPKARMFRSRGEKKSCPMVKSRLSQKDFLEFPNPILTKSTCLSCTYIPNLKMKQWFCSQPFYLPPYNIAPCRSFFMANNSNLNQVNNYWQPLMVLSANFHLALLKSIKTTGSETSTQSSDAVKSERTGMKIRELEDDEKT